MHILASHFLSTNSLLTIRLQCDLWSSSMPIVNELQLHVHMPSRPSLPWEQFNRQKTSRTIDNPHGKFWTFLFAQLFHCNSTSLTCNLPSLQSYTWITNTTNPPLAAKSLTGRKQARELNIPVWWVFDFFMCPSI